MLLSALAGAALLLQLNTYPNHDVAWILWGTRELLKGAAWGTDIIEPNPPLAWYLSVPTTATAMWANLPLDWTFRIAVALAAALSAGCFTWLLSDKKWTRWLVLSFTAGACLLLLPGREFGQREHLLVIAILPYLALSIRRLQCEQGPSNLPAIGIGIIAGLGVALKPYFVAVPVLVETAVVILGQRRLPLLRAENLALGSVLGVYTIALLVFERTYLREVVPLARAIYWSFDLPWADVWSTLQLRLLATAPFMAFALYKRDVIGIVLSAALCGFAASYLLQHKGYSYHLLPVSIASLILLAHFLTAETSTAIVRAAAVIAAFALTLICFLPVAGWWSVNKPGGARSAEIERIRSFIIDHASNGRFLVVAVHPYPAFPTALYGTAQHVSRTNSQWFLPAVAQIRSRHRHHAQAVEIERHAREFILHDLGATPGLVLIDTNSTRHTANSNSFDFLAFYQEDPAFRRAWKSYKEIERIGAYRAFVRTLPRQLPPGARGS